MPMFSQPSVSRSAGITAMATIFLAIAGVSFAIRGGSGTTTYIDYKREVVTCTATGGQAKYNYCNWQEPQGDSGSGSTITGIYYSVGKNYKAIGVDFTIGKSATASGTTTILNNILTTTGGVATSLTGAYLVDSGSYLRAVSLTPNGPTSNHTASMMIEYYTRLSR